ncbi:MAG: hypothetical protein LBE36_06980 [Flavobacteriaceae bacterium]|jgi:type II restriction/modification system DNA methylase subunit YeeA|nr:hypothetical protein [Flavobacteriaceae bacterium]
MNPKERRNLGAHYTSEKNILKLIKPLFLDELWQEFESITRGLNPLLSKKLQEFHKKLSELKFLDPACGCGNFLVISYRELRLLELEVLRALNRNSKGASPLVLDVSQIIWLDVDQFYGIEYEEFPVRIAEVAMWLIDHQMNMKISNEFGQYFVRLPLKKSAKIVHGNALKMDWENVLPHHCDTEPSSAFPQSETKRSSDFHQNGENIYIIGNPPFIGSRIMNKEQKHDLTAVF